MDSRAAFGECIGKAYAETYYWKSEKMITMRDGVRLFTSIYWPKDTVRKHPILIRRTPYSCAPYGREYTDELNSHHLGTYLTEGYIIVFQDVRGRYASGGRFMQIRPLLDDADAARSAEAAAAIKAGKRRPSGDVPTDEATDSYDTVDWLIGNVSGNNGRVGFTGNSYPGFYAILAGLCGHPAIKAVSPQAPVTDWFMGDDVHHDGAFCMADSFGFIPWLDVAMPPTHQYPERPQLIPDGMSKFDFFKEKLSIDSLTIALKAYGSGFWYDICSHPSYDEFWKARDTRRHCYDVRPAVLVTGGEYDAEDLYGAINLYKAICTQSPSTDCRLAFGPWRHGGWLGRSIPLYDQTPNYDYFYSMELPFFNYYLKGEGTLEDVPKALVYDTGTNVWNSFDEVPVEFASAAGSKSLRGKSLVLSLEEGRHLALNKKGKAGKEIASYVSDPADPVPFSDPKPHAMNYMYADQSFSTSRSDVAAFTSEVLDGSITVAGPVSVALNVSASTSDADFVVKLIDVDTTGYQLMVRGDIMPARFRNGFEKPEPLIPNEKAEVTFAMPDICHTFLPGHRIMVVVQSSWFPLFAMNPQNYVENIYKAKVSDFQASTIKVYSGSTVSVRTGR
jgi:putative CocE/NonD family hydrolase